MLHQDRPDLVGPGWLPLRSPSDRYAPFSIPSTRGSPATLAPAARPRAAGATTRAVGGPGARRGRQPAAGSPDREDRLHVGRARLAVERRAQSLRDRPWQPAVARRGFRQSGPAHVLRRPPLSGGRDGGADAARRPAACRGGGRQRFRRRGLVGLVADEHLRHAVVRRGLRRRGRHGPLPLRHRECQRRDRHGHLRPDDPRRRGLPRVCLGLAGVEPHESALYSQSHRRRHAGPHRPPQDRQRLGVPRHLPLRGRSFAGRRLRHCEQRLDGRWLGGDRRCHPVWQRHGRRALGAQRDRHGGRFGLSAGRRKLAALALAGRRAVDLIHEPVDDHRHRQRLGPGANGGGDERRHQRLRYERLRRLSFQRHHRQPEHRHRPRRRRPRALQQSHAQPVEPRDRARQADQCRHAGPRRPLRRRLEHADDVCPQRGLRRDLKPAGGRRVRFDDHRGRLPRQHARQCAAPRPAGPRPDGPQHLRGHPRTPDRLSRHHDRPRQRHAPIASRAGLGDLIRRRSGHGFLDRRPEFRRGHRRRVWEPGDGIPHLRLDRRPRLRWRHCRRWRQHPLGDSHRPRPEPALPVPRGGHQCRRGVAAI